MVSFYTVIVHGCIHLSEEEESQDKWEWNYISPESTVVITCLH